MSYPLNLVTGRVLRAGLAHHGTDGHRWIASETWYCDSIMNDSTVSSALQFRCNQWRRPFGSGPGSYFYDALGMTFQTIAGYGRLGGYSIAWSMSNPPNLNPAAPEAAFRLQRVGADGAASKYGRICLPILDDTFYLDLPHRRQVNVDLLQPQLEAVTSLWLQVIPIEIGFMRNIIFDRKNKRGTDVTSYRLLANPVRLWQRWRHYPTPPHTYADDQKWFPPRYWR